MKEMLDKELEKTLPRIEEYIDCCGQTIKFQLYLERSFDPGFLLVAQEVTDNEYGYCFRVFAEANPFDGLGRLRMKIRRGISKKYLIRKGESTYLSHDELSGLITNFGLVVDGELLSWKALRDLLLIKQGCQIDMKLSGNDE